MKRISPERRAATLAKLLPPDTKTVTAVAQMERISKATLYNWRNQAKSEGKPVPGAEKNSEQWSAEARFAVIVETATLSEAEIAEYCRKKDFILSIFFSRNRVLCRLKTPMIKPR